MEKLFLDIEAEINYDQKEFRNHLLQLSDNRLNGFTTNLKGPPITNDFLDKIKGTINKIYESKALEMKMQAQIELITNEICELEIIPDEELVQLRKKAYTAKQDDEVIERKIKQINKVKYFYERLKINVESIDKNTFKVTFCDSLSSPIGFVEICKKEVRDSEIYEVLKQEGIPDEVFDIFNMELMKTDNISNFIACMRKYFDESN